MSISAAWAFQQALFARLTAVLAGQGPGGVDVKVTDHVPRNPARVHCRLEGFNVTPEAVKADKTSHRFSVELYDRPEDGSTSARGQKTVKRLQALIVASLHDWQSGVAGATPVEHRESFIAPDQDGLTQHASSRFSVQISPS